MRQRTQQGWAVKKVTKSCTCTYMCICIFVWFFLVWYLFNILNFSLFLLDAGIWYWCNIGIILIWYLYGIYFFCIHIWHKLFVWKVLFKFCVTVILAESYYEYIKTMCSFYLWSFWRAFSWRVCWCHRHEDVSILFCVNSLIIDL